MNVSQETIGKIQRFAEKRGKAEEVYKKQQQPNTSTFHDYNKRLDDTLRELQYQVKRQEDDLRKLREVNSIDLSRIGTDPWSRVSQVRRAKEAYDSLVKSRTELPDLGSPLPSLLAVGETSRLIKESKVSISMTAEKLSSHRQRLKTEEANLRDAQTIKDGLEKRLENIRNEKTEKHEKTPSQLAREFVEEQELKIAELDNATESLKHSLHAFINDHLSSMLAAEDLGGPTVGDAMDITDATLERGYTNYGRPKKPKSSDVSEHDSNQRRIDDMVRSQGQGDNTRTGPSNKREAVAAELNSLLETLLEAGSSYIDLPRESAASRFLVRAKVAQFHPRNARKLKLIDFGRSLND
ncbi:hypothetical protein EYZ11_004531 [Aspergillus tanneri]|uniref:Uncharacterized protein n=1 Tax=Aspergillus tanneri TaxID=1220188 RepID=A0A4V3UPP4_9EURO|nr:uncharacterized protein ATNIH1004_008432 [Aspergillus tanneri]KAA8644233.1 hypothetical protein ATNIH1004_008432 [Aspergillus tanneri]THC95984.1 hypothetical protein EYZ11_004531 [Aspergillus tanneri]